MLSLVVAFGFSGPFVVVGCIPYPRRNEQVTLKGSEGRFGSFTWF